MTPALNLPESLLRHATLVEPAFYVDFKVDSKHGIGSRDGDDWSVVALALALSADVWTEDSDFFGSALATWTAETEEIFFKSDPWQINEAGPLPYAQDTVAEFGARKHLASHC